MGSQGTEEGEREGKEEKNERREGGKVGRIEGNRRREKAKQGSERRKRARKRGTEGGRRKEEAGKRGREVRESSGKNVVKFCCRRFSKIDIYPMNIKHYVV